MNFSQMSIKKVHKYRANFKANQKEFTDQYLLAATPNLLILTYTAITVLLFE